MLCIHHELMFPRYLLGMWFTFTLIFYKCWTSVPDTGILSLNLKIDKSCLKTVNGNLKSTEIIKNDNFPHFQRRISASIWNLAWLCQGRGSWLSTEQVSDIQTLISLQGRPVQCLNLFLPFPFPSPPHPAMQSWCINHLMQRNQPWIWKKTRTRCIKKSPNTYSVSFTANLSSFY